jgi:hypothetical protein
MKPPSRRASRNAKKGRGRVWVVFCVAALICSLSAHAADAAGPGTWTLLGLDQYTINSMAVDPHDPNALYAGTTNSGIFKSIDKGASWTAINGGIDVSIQSFFAIIVDPNNSNILYAGGSQLQGGGAGIFKSTDGGGNWTIVNNGIVDVGFNGPPSYVQSMVMDPNNSSILYVALGVHCGAIYKTTDAATTWTRTGAACDPVALQLDPSNSNVIYASADGGVLWKSNDAAQTWNVASTSSFNTLPIDPFNTSVLYGSKHNGGAYRSTDSGANWSALNGPAGIYRALITDPSRPDTLFLGQLFAGTNRVYISRDGGSNWTDTGGIWSTVGVRFLIRPPNDNNVLYALTDAGLYSYGIVDPAPTVQVHGTVYMDANANGTRDNGEQSYAGATLRLFYGHPPYQALSNISTVSDSNGAYSLALPQSYQGYWVKIELPAGYRGTNAGVANFAEVDTTKDFGIKAQTSLPLVFSDDFTDANDTTLAAHNGAWTTIEQAMPTIQNDHLYFAQGTNPLGPTQFVMTDQCISVDTVAPNQNGIFLSARNGVGFGYGSYLNTTPSYDLYDVAINSETGGFPGGLPFPKALLDGGPHTLKFCAIGNTLSLYLDRMLIHQATDSRHPQGFMTLGTGPNTLDNFKIEGILAGPAVYAVTTNNKNVNPNNNIVAAIGSTGIPAGDTANVSVATGTFAGPTGCTDSQGNTYTVAADRNTGQGRVFVCTGHIGTALSPGDTITATYPGFSGISVISVNAIGTVATNGTVLAANSANGNSAAPNSGNISTGGPTVLFGVIANNSTPTFTPGANYTIVGQVSGGSGSSKRTLSPEFRIVPSGGTYSVGGTISNGGQFWQAAILGYAGN